MESVTEHGEISYKDGIYYVWDETWSDTIIETSDVDLAFETYKKYSEVLEFGCDNNNDIRTYYPQARWSS